MQDQQGFCMQATEAANAEAAQATEGTNLNEGVDQWLIDFAGLFREQLNIEPDRHLDLTGQAWDSLQAAMDGAVQDERAVELFDQAWKKFQEVSASGEDVLASRPCQQSSQALGVKSL